MDRGQCEAASVVAVHWTSIVPSGGDSPAPPHTQTVNLEGGVASPPSDRPAAALIPPEPGDDAEVDFDDDDELSLGG